MVSSLKGLISNTPTLRIHKQVQSSKLIQSEVRRETKYKEKGNIKSYEMKTQNNTR